LYDHVITILIGTKIYHDNLLIGCFVKFNLFILGLN